MSIRPGAAVFWLGFLAPSIALLAVWLPELHHYYVRSPDVSPAEAHLLLEALPDSVCSEFAQISFDSTMSFPAQQLEQAKREAAAGLYAAPGGAILPFAPHFARTELSGDAAPPDLDRAMLIIPQLLLTAYESSGDLALLSAARDYLRGWWRFEKASWRPTGFQWNDHAVAGRIYPLSHFLCAADALDDFNDAQASEIISALLASGKRLAKPGYYTYRTNHGLMQSIALLHLATLFPTRAESATFIAIAQTRIVEQLAYYLSPEGVVLEHSAGYHEFGVYLVSLILRYYAELDLPPPPGLLEKYAAARVVLAQLQRPDGSMPAWGNTQSSGRASLEPLEMRSGSASGEGNVGSDCPRAESLAAPVSGLLIWWERALTSPCEETRLSQTAVVWSNFPSRAHKHVDEMSAYIWSGGFNILTGSGYWPYQDIRNAVALGWASGNGPRFVGEHESERGVTSPVRIGRGELAEFIDLERTSQSGGSLRRQILYMRPDRWLIVDSDISDDTSDDREFEFHLTVDPRLSVVRAADAPPLTELFYVLRANTEVARIQFSGCRGGSTSLVHGSSRPFIGWTAERGTIEMTDAVLRRCPAGTVSIAQIELAKSSPYPLRPDAAEHDVRGTEEWTIPLTGSTASRRGDIVELRNDGASLPEVALHLTPIDGYEEAVGAIGRDYADAAAANPRYNESWVAWRIKITRLLLALAVLHVALLVGARLSARQRPALRRWLPAAGVVSIVLWVMLAYGLSAFYFTE